MTEITYRWSQNFNLREVAAKILARGMVLPTSRRSIPDAT